MRSLNNACEEGGLDVHMFESAFEVWYPTLEGKLADALGSDAGDGVGREAGDEVTELLEEILELSRTNQLLLRNSDGDLADDMAAIKNCINRVETRLEHGRIALDGCEPSIQKRRAMVEELRAGVLPGLDARPRFLLLLGLVRDSFPWLYA